MSVCLSPGLAVAAFLKKNAYGQMWKPLTQEIVLGYPWPGSTFSRERISLIYNKEVFFCFLFNFFL